MNHGHPGHGDTGLYPCPRCPTHHALTELVDHLDHHASTTPDLTEPAHGDTDQP